VPAIGSVRAAVANRSIKISNLKKINLKTSFWKKGKKKNWLWAPGEVCCHHLLTSASKMLIKIGPRLGG
jgi:hypothetical protein